MVGPGVLTVRPSANFDELFPVIPPMACTYSLRHVLSHGRLSSREWREQPECRILSRARNIPVDFFPVLSVQLRPPFSAYLSLPSFPLMSISPSHTSARVQQVCLYF